MLGMFSQNGPSNLINGVIAIPEHLMSIVSLIKELPRKSKSLIASSHLLTYLLTYSWS
jgi:hypothetical protein